MEGEGEGEREREREREGNERGLTNLQGIMQQPLHNEFGST
jgi:hypothetical protein